MKIMKFGNISEMKKFIDSEGSESDILEYKNYRSDEDADRHKDDIINSVVALANKEGGYFIIGVDDNRKVVYTTISYSRFKDKVEKWMDSYVDPRGLLSLSIDLISDNNGQCIIIYVYNKPGTCFARRTDGREKGVTFYSFPYRIGASTKILNFEEFFKIYMQKFLESLAASSEIIKKEEERLPPLSVIDGVSEEGPFDSELVNKYVNMLRTRDFSTKIINLLLESIRSEAYKVFSREEIDKKALPAIKNLVEFACSFVKDKNEENAERIFDILYLLTGSPDTLDIVKKICYDHLKALYESGKRYNDLIKILDACGHFEDRINEIMRAIESKDEKLLDILISKLDFTAIQNKYDLIEKLILKMESLDSKRDKRIIDKMKHLKRRLEEI